MEITLIANSISVEYHDCGSHQLAVTLDMDSDGFTEIETKAIKEIKEELAEVQAKYMVYLGKTVERDRIISVLSDLHAYAKLGYEGAAAQLAEKMDELLPESEMAKKFP